MARKKKDPTVTSLTALIVIKPPTKAQIEEALTAAQAAISELQTEAEALVISDHLTYNYADSLLSRIIGGEKVTEEKIRPIITPLREPLDAIYEARRGVDKPLGTLKELVKKKMGDYQIEQKKLRDVEAERDRQTAIQLLEEQAAKLRMDEELAAVNDESPMFPSAGEWPSGGGFTPPIPEPTQITFLAPPTTAPAPIAAHSTTRFERRCRVIDIDLLVDAALSSIVPLDILTFKPSAVQGYFISQPELVAGWPGVEIYDHPIITGRS